MKMHDIKDSETLWNLRNEIVLGSIFVNDYENSLGIDASDVCNFFDSYMEYLSCIHYDENNGTDDTFWGYVAEHDNIVNLYNFFVDYIEF